ncbi:scrFIAM, partial [Symbiodinium microadriaticum]
MSDRMTISIVRDDEVQCTATVDRNGKVEEEILKVVCEEQQNGFRWLGHYLTFSSEDWKPQIFSKIAMKKEPEPMKSMKVGSEKVIELFAV